MTSVWAAPGRVNLIGEHIDYNDGFVLPFALPFTTTAKVSTRDGDTVSVSSDGVGDTEFAVQTAPGETEGWAAYVAGVVWALRDEGAEIPGLRIELSSDVPSGAGLSSSAALTCSVAAAINDELQLGLERTVLARLARRSENDYVGVATGMMDQLASMLCRSGNALLLDCRSLETTQVPFDPPAAGLTLLLVDTHARHQLVGSEYSDRRNDCDAALAELGLPTWRDATLDDVLTLTDERLRRRARHVVTETQRVRDVSDVLAAGNIADIGAFLSASHDSMRDDFEISVVELDVTVETAIAAGALGARMTGGGFGGCAVVLCRDEDAGNVRSQVEAAYARHEWEPPSIYTPQPSDGARSLADR